MNPDGTRYKLRRAHEKSRNGCLRCKQQRKKCDELRPKCSRCAKRMHDCEYQSHRWICEVPFQSASSADTLSASGSSQRGSSTPLSSCPPSADKNYEAPPLNSDPPGALDATELDLLSHYLTHTSQTIPFDHLDHYALSVGMPNLAFKSRAVMSSLVALAAACKCHDLAKPITSLDQETMTKIRELLMLAERHHRSSLQHIQVALSSSDGYDNILANAALMVLYASASHSIRVYFAATARRTGQKLPHEVLPQHSQWMTFTRAAHTASSAVLNGIVDTITNHETNPNTPSSITRTPALGNPTLNEEIVLSPQDGPSEDTKRLFLPLVAATHTRALETLRRKAESTVASIEGVDGSTCSHPLGHACLETLSILERCATDALSPKENSANPSSPVFEPLLLGHLQKVSPWVGQYMVSVTSMTSPKALRRTIMSFLNKASAEFLSLVQSMLDSSFAGTGAENMTPDSSESEGPSLNSIRLLAMDIFSHWLVLVMLLDGVWWIGGIGEWELGQAIALMKTRDPLHRSPEARESWWPESMHLVKLELNPSI